MNQRSECDQSKDSRKYETKITFGPNSYLAVSTDWLICCHNNPPT